MQCQQGHFRHRNHLAAVADLGLDVGNVTHLAGAVDDDKNLVVAFVEEHQVVNDAAVVIEQQAVALLAHGQIDHVHRHQGLESGGGVGAHQAQLAHVGHIKQAGGRAGVVVFGHQAGWVLHGHGIAGKRHHAGAQRDMQVVQRNVQEARQQGVWWQSSANSGSGAWRPGAYPNPKV